MKGFVLQTKPSSKIPRVLLEFYSNDFYLLWTFLLNYLSTRILFKRFLLERLPLEFYSNDFYLL